MTDTETDADTEVLGATELVGVMLAVTYDTTDVGAWSVMALACDQGPVPEMQVKLFSEYCRLVEPGAYTCALSVLRMAAAHEPADVSEHVVTYWMTVGANGLYTQLTGFPTVCSARAAAVDVTTPQPIDDGDTPRMEASWTVIVPMVPVAPLATGGEQPAPAGCVRERRGARRQVWGACGGVTAHRAARRDYPFMFLSLHGAPTHHVKRHDDVCARREAHERVVGGQAQAHAEADGCGDDERRENASNDVQVAARHCCGRRRLKRFGRWGDRRLGRRGVRHGSRRARKWPRAWKKETVSCACRRVEALRERRKSVEMLGKIWGK